MFEGITIRGGQSNFDRSIDIGSFAEALLFYQNVHLILDRSSISSLVKSIGIDNLRLLLDRGYCSATFLRDNVAVYSQPIVGTPFSEHGFVSFQLASKGGEKRALHNREHIVDSLLRVKDTDIPRGKIERLSERITVRSTKDLSITSIGPLESARADLDDTDYLRTTVAKLLSLWVPEYELKPQDFIKVKSRGERFLIDTNLDFERLNSFYHQRVSPSHSSVTPALLVERVLSTRIDIAFALKYGTDIIVSDLSSQLMQLRIQGLLERRIASASNLTRFEDMIIPNTKSIREAINSGDLVFSDFLKLLEEAQKFKLWLKGVAPDGDLVDNYYKEISKKHWVDRLSTKVTRFSLFTLGGLSLDALGLGGLGTATGVMLSTADAFLVDRMLGGWKPNQFVEDHLVKALSRKEDK
jgi:hypothetical protein